MNRVAIIFAALAFTTTASAAEVAGVRLDDRMSLGGQELVLNGAGIRTKLVFKVYVASLYLLQKASDLQGVLTRAPRRIQLNLLRSLTADQLVDALIEGLTSTSTPEQLAPIKAQIEQLIASMRSFQELKDKDVVTLDFVDGATRIGLNGEGKGTIAGDAFNQALTRIWLGEKPAQADLKRALLGG